MKELYELRNNLCDELKKYAKKDLSAGSLDVVDKLSHSIKNIDKVIDHDGGYSNGYEIRNDRNMNGRRYSTEGYSYEEDMIPKLHKMMDETNDDRKRQEIRRFIQRMENM